MPGGATGLRSTKSPTAIAAVPTVRAAGPQTNREKMRVLHLIRRIGAPNRGNIITPRQIEWPAQLNSPIRGTIAIFVAVVAAGSRDTRYRAARYGLIRPVFHRLDVNASLLAPSSR